MRELENVTIPEEPERVDVEAQESCKDQRREHRPYTKDKIFVSSKREFLTGRKLNLRNKRNFQNQQIENYLPRGKIISPTCRGGQKFLTEDIS